MASIIPNSDHRRTIGPIRLVIRIIRLFWLLLVSLALLPLLPVIGKKRSAVFVRWWHGRLIRVFNIDVHVQGHAPQQPALIVANHSTWLDIVVLGHVFDAVFISKTEVSGWSLIGPYARSCGTLFLARGAFRTNETRKQIRTRFAERRSVILFPQGTTVASLRPTRFFPRLFSAALDNNGPVVPVAVRYSDADTPPGCHHPLVPWADSPLLSNFIDVLRLPSLQVDVTICPSINSDGHDRRTLAQASHDAIDRQLRLTERNSIAEQ